MCQDGMIGRDLLPRVSLVNSQPRVPNKDTCNREQHSASTLSRPDGIDLDQLHHRARMLQELIKLGDLYNKAEPTTTQMSQTNRHCDHHGMRLCVRRSSSFPTAAEWQATSDAKRAAPPSHATHSPSIIHITETAAHQSVRPRRPSRQWRRKSLRCTAKEELYDEQRRKRQMHRTGGGALNPLARVTSQAPDKRQRGAENN